jgi:hypothetical protein
MVTPVARREAVAHLVGMFEVSDGRGGRSPQGGSNVGALSHELLRPIVVATYLRSGGA